MLALDTVVTAVAVDAVDAVVIIFVGCFTGRPSDAIHFSCIQRYAV